MPKISVIVPVYNVEAYLERSLNSLKNQTFKDLEFIIVDDGSTDGSAKIIKEFVKSDKRFSYHKKKNGGLSDARNYGMKYATGKYLAFLDSDDYIDLDLYEKMYEKAVETKADVVEADFIWEYPNKQVKDISKVTDLGRLLVDIRVVAWNKLYKKSLIDKIGVKFSKGLRYEDVDWCYKIVPYIKTFASVHGTYIHYIQRPNSIANTQNEKVRDIYKILENAIIFYQKNNLLNKYFYELEYSCLRIIYGSSFLRVMGINNKKLRNSIIKEGTDFLNKYFPNYKKNIYLLSDKTKKNYYYRTINSFTLPIYIKLFRLLKKVK